MKSYTDIGQSKKLAEILPIESADMYWELDKNCLGVEAYNLVPLLRYNTKERLKLFGEDKDLIPAWSLAALLEIIPKDIEGLNRLRIDIDNVDFSIWYDDLKGCGVNDKLPDITLKEPVDACVEMILKLHEQSLL